VVAVIPPNLSAVRLSCSACGATAVVGYPPLHFRAEHNLATPEIADPTDTPDSTVRDELD